MYLATASFDLRGARERVLVLSWLQSAGYIELMDDVLRSLGYRIDDSGFENNRSGSGAVYWFRQSDDWFFFETGLGTNSVAQTVWNAYLGSAYSTDPNPRNSVIVGIGTENNRLHPVWRDRRPARTFYAGHSLGGAVVLEMLRSDATSGVSGTLQATTFGSPMSCGGTWARDLNFADATRFFNSDDPVPLLPPRLEGWTRFMACTTWQAATLANYRSSPLGREINFDGSTSFKLVPTQASLINTQSIQYWLATIDANVESPHSLTAYTGRLAAAVSQLPASGNGGGSPTPWNGGGGAYGGYDPDRPSVTNSEAARRLDAIQTSFIAERAGQVDPQVVIPTQQLFHARRVGKVWQVEFGAIIIAFAPRKRTARALARAGNDFLRKLQREGQVQAHSLSQQFVAYLAAASDPDSGFVPQLRTG